MNQSILLKGFFQIGYATNNLDKALALYKEKYDMGPFAEIREVPAQGPNNTTMLTNFALAYKGDTMIEFIQPLEGDTGMFDHVLPKGSDDFIIRHHHFAYCLDSMEELDGAEAMMKNQGIEIPIRGNGMDQVFFFYADTRPWTGHYSEYLTLTDKGREAYAQLPRY
jgi:hypothetical protein